jgi:hypothetical protein
MGDEWVARERSYRGISIRLAVQYLTTLGGEPDDENRVVADDWEATLSAETVGVGPSLTLTQVNVVFEGDPETLDSLVDRFSQKAMRAGG